MTDTLEYGCEDLTVRVKTFDADILPRLVAEIDRLNKVAVKLGVPTITYTELGRGTREKVVDDVFFTAFDAMVVGKHLPTVTVETVTVKIDGLTPMLPGGWKFLGAVEFLTGENDGEALIHGDDPRLAPYRDRGRVCDHCNTNRLRKKIVVLVNEDGELTGVGSTCLKDFLGYHGNPERVIWLVDEAIGMLDDLDGGGRFGRIPEEVPTDIFLAMAAAMVREFGWVAKSAYNGIPTAYRVADRFFPPMRTKHNGDYLDEILPVTITDEDEAKVKLARDWLATDAGDGNYIDNLRVLVKANNVGRKHFGLVASLIGAYDRAMGVKLEWEIRKAAEDKARRESEWVGALGKRIEFSATVTFVHLYETAYGTSRIVSMVDGDGNKLKTFTSGAWAYGIEVGDVVTGKGTVSEHGEWKGTKETVLKRVAGKVTVPATDTDDE